MTSIALVFKSFIRHFKPYSSYVLNKALLVYWHKIPLTHFLRSKNKYEQY